MAITERMDLPQNRKLERVEETSGPLEPIPEIMAEFRDNCDSDKGQEGRDRHRMATEVHILARQTSEIIYETS